ncbi:hypothetical protein [Marininema halotolerans]|nr:hypothetical protein [Marininema halotolerans]
MFTWIITSVLAIISLMAITLKFAGKSSEGEANEDLWSSEN